jgi:hypothetical protein
MPLAHVYRSAGLARRATTEGLPSHRVVQGGAA